MELYSNLDPSIICLPFIKFQNCSQVHFKKRSFVIIKNKIDIIDINFIKVVKTD